MISFLLPFYRRLDWFRLSLPHNAPVFGADAEVVIALDEPSETAALLDTVWQWPSIRFVVVQNEKEHDWRPPCKAINVSARHASGDYLAIMSPESIVEFPPLLTLNSKQGVFGLLWNIEVPCDGHAIYEKLKHYKTSWPPANFGYGFILIPTWAFESIRGYNEQRQVVHGDDLDFRIRLLRFGLPFAVNPDIHIFHPWHPRPPHKDSFESASNVPILANKDWGKDFSKVVFDWKKK